MNTTGKMRSEKLLVHSKSENVKTTNPGSQVTLEVNFKNLTGSVVSLRKVQKIGGTDIITFGNDTIKIEVLPNPLGSQ